MLPQQYNYNYHTFSELHTARIRMHLNLLLAILLTDSLTLWQHQSASPCDATTLDANTTTNAMIVCRARFVLAQYCRLASLAWTLCEGVRLTHLLTSSAAAFTADQESLTRYLAFGWLGPLAPMTAFCLLRVFVDESDPCWMTPGWISQWSIVGPSLAVVVVNAAFLARITYDVVLKVRASRESEVVQFV